LDFCSKFKKKGKSIDIIRISHQHQHSRLANSAPEIRKEKQNKSQTNKPWPSRTAKPAPATAAVATTINIT
jgi:hypothetical protein